MSNKLTILYLIDSLGVGGAENLLTNIVNATADRYRNILVYLDGPHDLADKITGAEIICLHKSGKAALPAAALQLRTIIRAKGVDIVTAHSYWTNILARFATPSTVALINTYHFADYDTLYEDVSCRRMIWLDKRTHSRRMQLVAVSAYVQDILERRCGYRDNIRTIPNFISESFRLPVADAPSSIQAWDSGKPLRLVAVGSIKREKNYELLIEAFSRMADWPVTLDVWGGGGEKLTDFRQRAVDAGARHLQFKGPSTDLPGVLPAYDAYVMSSFSEACPLSPIEALSCGLPLLLSDIPPLKEIAAGNAYYFRSGNADSFVALVKDLLNGTKPLVFDRLFAEERLARYSKDRCLSSLHDLYQEAAAAAGR